MSELGNVPLWQLKEKIEFGTNKTVELPNGNRKTDFQVDYKMNAARFRISMLQNLDKVGVSISENNNLVIRHRYDIDYNSYKARWRGRIYNVTHILSDNSKLITYDIISLKNTQKNG